MSNWPSALKAAPACEPAPSEDSKTRLAGCPADRPRNLSSRCPAARARFSWAPCIVVCPSWKVRRCCAPCFRARCRCVCRLRNSREFPTTTTPPEGHARKPGRRQSTGLIQRVCNAPLKELPATLPSTHLTHANSLHTATAVPHIPYQSKPAQAGLAPTHYLFFLLTWPFFLLTWPRR